MELLKDVLTVIFVLAMFVGILYLTYVATKFIGKRYSVSGKSFKNLKIVETVAIGADRQLVIIKTADKYLLLGSTAQQISLICELDENSISEEQNDASFQTMSFSEALKKVTKEKFFKNSDKEIESTEEQNNAE